MKGRIIVTKKKGILDPEGDTIGAALERIGFKGVKGVRVAKVFEIDLESADKDAVQAQLTDMADRLLKNPVMEDASVEILS